MSQTLKIKRIIDKKTQKQRGKSVTKYLVQWQGPQGLEEVWENERQLGIYQQQIKQFNQKNKLGNWNPLISQLKQIEKDQIKPYQPKLQPNTNYLRSEKKIIKPENLIFYEQEDDQSVKRCDFAKENNQIANLITQIQEKNRKKTQISQIIIGSAQRTIQLHQHRKQNLLLQIQNKYANRKQIQKCFPTAKIQKTFNQQNFYQTQRKIRILNPNISSIQQNQQIFFGMYDRFSKNQSQKLQKITHKQAFTQNQKAKQNSNIQILYRHSRNGYDSSICYTVKDKEQIKQLTHAQICTLNPIALIRFYEIYRKKARVQKSRQNIQKAQQFSGPKMNVQQSQSYS